MRRFNVKDYSVSPDLRYALLATNPKQVARYSKLAQYIVYDVETSLDFPLVPQTGRLPETSDISSIPHIQAAVWAPQGNAIVLVHNNDIFYKAMVMSEEVIRITNTGVNGVVYNGVPDWLYEEEILTDSTTMWFSKDGKNLMFATFNDSYVNKMEFPWYGVPTEQFPYQKMESIRYPKSGQVNPTITLYTVDLTDDTKIELRNLKPPVGIIGRDYYVTAATWMDNNQVSVVWMNRAQNMSIFSTCRGNQWFCQTIHTERVQDLGWIDNYDSPIFNNEATAFVTTVPVQDAQFGFFKHIVLVNVIKKRMTPITQGRFTVTKIVGWDEKNNSIYYLAAPNGKPGERHVYRVADLAAETPRQIYCLTCDYNNESEHYCLYHNIVFSPNYKYYILECRGPNVPHTYLYSTHNTENSTMPFLMQNNSALKEVLTDVALPIVRNLQVDIGNGFKAQVKMFLPPGLRDDEAQRYPMVVNVYGAPGSQLVTEEWRVHWPAYLSSQKDIVSVWIDGRGTGYQGDKLKHAVYKKLGTVEAEDQLRVIRYLLKTQDYVHPDFVAMWGWSYGGYVTGMTLAADPLNVLRCGIMVAPVTDWLLYDSAYTERYMGSPNSSGNFKSYEQADLSKRAASFRNKMFFLIHGTADDNVHLQHSMVFSKALIDVGILFRQQIYTDENHHLLGVKYHLHQSMELFLDECFKEYNPDDTLEKPTEIVKS